MARRISFVVTLTFLPVCCFVYAMWRWCCNLYLCERRKWRSRHVTVLLKNTWGKPQTWLGMCTAQHKWLLVHEVRLSTQWSLHGRSGYTLRFVDCFCLHHLGWSTTSKERDKNEAFNVMSLPAFLYGCETSVKNPSKGNELCTVFQSIHQSKQN
jgi:hypothetical protein